MVTHLKMHCTGNTCEVCHQNFADNAGLHAHMLTHVGMSPVECTICQKRFAYKWCLRNHMQSHMSSKQFEYDTLQQAFLKRYGQPSDHGSSHDDRYTCQICQTSFRDKGNFSRHMLIHTGESFGNFNLLDLFSLK